jgi:dTDP-4-amino-4,6-dideoxygalactose transaminase
MAAMLLEIKPGDEVIVPSYTFVSTPNAFVVHGAIPIFCDIRPDTLNMDESMLEALITPRTKGIVPVHYAGVPCEMDQVMVIANRHQIPVVEDNAHGLFAKYNGRSLGTMGCMATQSFHETKNITCGEGGALLINDEHFVERAEIIREKGTNRSRFFQGQVDKYSWVDLGSSYVMSDVLAAFLYAQLEVWQSIQSKRRQIWNHYHDSLADWSNEQGVCRPIVPDHCEQAYHMYYLIFPSFERRQALIGHLKERGILAVFHYLPLHLSAYATRWDGGSSHCPVAEDVSGRLLRLPFYNSITEEDQQRVIEAIFDFRFS